MKVKKATRETVIAKLNDIRSANASKKEVYFYTNGFRYASSYIYELFKRTNEKMFDMYVHTATETEKQSLIYAILDLQKSKNDTYYIAETDKYYIYVLYDVSKMTRYEMHIVMK